MKVLELIRAASNWEEILAAAPYFIKTTWDGDYAILKYNQLASDFNEQIVRECRGTIFYIPKRDGGWAYPVAVPFYKFGNYGESYVPNIDWSSAKVKEKVDGSLMKVWYHKDEWHVSTNGTIDAHNAPTSVEKVSFYDIFMRALEKNGNPRDFFNSLDINYTYMFELVSRETRVTIEYPETALYYLGSRSLCTLLEEELPASTDDAVFFKFVKLPRIYPLRTLEDCITAVNAMGADEEGFVVCDRHFNRMKIKSPEYLMAARICNNNIITVKRVMEAMRGGYIDDLYAYLPDYHPYIDDTLNAYNYIAMKCDHAYRAVVERMQDNPSLRLFEAVQVEDPKYRDYCFKRMSGRVCDEYDYLEKRVSLGQIIDWVKAEMKK